ncbi:family 43 glycosylhydrolase [Paenibacillus sp. LHD-117]|uniref:family 43 glycosylhydrolase n=1 Tax=Paenibacillus sp. LHD-117 TaxID=3071412 RepID=UPI0027DEDFEB|nr:family 43 glycosylhydrolase [Paenibacillus sp. LHD-117]MDQ6418470.1 family 43 glycosylhydrolase [Paenibacillus sp. LHD-117]
MNYLCNPINISYKYQFNKTMSGEISVSREAADPSMIMFKSRYYIFPSMTCGFLYSDDMAEWKFYALKSLPAYDYAPDVRVVGDYVYFCASSHESCSFYRTKDLFSDKFEEIKSAFPFWDPNLFADDDGRIYLYWGSSPNLPLYGIELNPADMMPIGEKKELIVSNVNELGYERSGENHVPPRSPEQIAEMLKGFEQGSEGMSEELKNSALAYITGAPYIEGVWMNKHNGIYYLQYASSGSRYNVYGDGVYVGDSPLGPFKLAKNNPYSYKPGGFIPGAGHGSTMEDQYGNLWHTATMRINMSHHFERRVGIWPAGWDHDGDLFCNQRYGDWPISVEQAKLDPWAKPEWMLLSYGKTAKASSCAEGKIHTSVTDENVQTWWKASSNKPGEWIEVDLGKEYDVHAVQINFADDGLSLPLPEGAELKGALHEQRWIDETPQPTRWKLEGSTDGSNNFVIEDKSDANTDLPHDLVVNEKGIKARFIKLTVVALPYGQAACVSGLRVFGLGSGKAPEKATDLTVNRAGDLDLDLSWKGTGTGYVVEWGYAPDKLYHSYQVFEQSVRIGGLVKGQETYIRVDSFNDSGITEGDIIKV